MIAVKIQDYRSSFIITVGFGTYSNNSINISLFEQKWKFGDLDAIFLKATDLNIYFDLYEIFYTKYIAK